MLIQESVLTTFQGDPVRRLRAPPPVLSLLQTTLFLCLHVTLVYLSRSHCKALEYTLEEKALVISAGEVIPDEI